MLNKKILIIWTSVLLLASCWKEYSENIIVDNTTTDTIISEVLNDMKDEDNKKWDEILSEVMNWLTLSQEEINWLIQMREEEKLARDTYTFFYEKYGQKIFWNIDDSEEKHKSAILPLLEKYNIDDPIKDDTPWIFTSEEMNKLYNDLVVAWNKSLVDALNVWMTIEDLDIKDLNELLVNTKDKDIMNVYNNLLKGSYNHMRAFYKNLEKKWEVYVPQYITIEEYNSIISK